jgi:hypothetical protein
LIARGFGDIFLWKKPLKPGIAVGVKHALEALRMVAGMFAFAIR